MSSYKGIAIKSEGSLYNCEEFPVDQILRIDDDYCSKSGYFEMHDLEFYLPEITYGNQEVRKSYNITKELKKYFAKRYFFFTLFDEGIQLDNESWYSVVAEPISLYLCERLKYYGVTRLLEPFSGIGGISVHAAGNFDHLAVNDIDENKIKMLKNNLSIYGKGLNLLTIMNKDALLIKPYKVDAVLICPPWGGIDISEYSYRDLDEIMNPKLSHILNHFKQFSQNMVIQMPKNTNLKNFLKIINMCFLPPIVKVEKVLVDGRVSQLFIFVGDVSFTAVNPEVFKTILIESKKPIPNLKLAKKDIKIKIKQENFDVFSEIFSNATLKLNKHVFLEP